MHAKKEWPGLDAQFPQALRQLHGIHPQCFVKQETVYPVDIYCPRLFNRQLDFRNIFQHARVAGGDSALAGHYFFHPFDLSAPQSGLEIGQAEVVTQLVMQKSLLFLKAEVAQAAGPFGQLSCSHQHHTTLTGRHQLVGVEAESAYIAQAAAPLPLVFGTMHFRRILDDDQLVPAGDIQDRVHVSRMAVDVHHQDRFATRCNPGLDLPGIHLPGTWIRIHQHRYAAGTYH